MSVRPIPLAEEIKASGHPFVNIFAIFGASQGLLVYLHRQRIPFRSNWLASPGNPRRFALLVLGGYIGGGLVGMSAFADWDVVRLLAKHQEDIDLRTDGRLAPLKDL